MILLLIPHMDFYIDFLAFSVASLAALTPVSMPHRFQGGNGPGNVLSSSEDTSDTCLEEQADTR